MTLMSFAIPLGRSGARVTLHNVGIRLSLCEREVLCCPRTHNEWFPSREQAWAGRQDRNPAMAHTSPQIQGSNGLASSSQNTCLSPSGASKPPLMPQSFNHIHQASVGDSAMGQSCWQARAPLPRPPVLLRYTPELLMALKGNSERYGAEKPMGHTMKQLNEQWMTELMSFQRCFGAFSFIWQCFKSKKEWNEGSNLQHVLHSDTHITPMFRLSASKPLQTKKGMNSVVQLCEDQAWFPLPLD